MIMFESKQRRGALKCFNQNQSINNSLSELILWSIHLCTSETKIIHSIKKLAEAQSVGKSQTPQEQRFCSVRNSDSFLISSVRVWPWEQRNSTTQWWTQLTLLCWRTVCLRCCCGSEEFQNNWNCFTPVWTCDSLTPLGLRTDLPMVSVTWVSFHFLITGYLNMWISLK